MNSAPETPADSFKTSKTYKYHPPASGPVPSSTSSYKRLFPTSSQRPIQRSHPTHSTHRHALVRLLPAHSSLFHSLDINCSLHHHLLPLLSHLPLPPLLSHTHPPRSSNHLGKESQISQPLPHATPSVVRHDRDCPDPVRSGTRGLIQILGSCSMVLHLSSSSFSFPPRPFQSIQLPSAPTLLDL
ncbi:hypothetical protein B0O80DRAFT_278544 [Mortierella sp. GBAus27b]|nr:hypothetical protein B0O80DRAFT_278544 [Mortierella sp. GBAus27b]